METCLKAGIESDRVRVTLKLSNLDNQCPN